MPEIEWLPDGRVVVRHRSWSEAFKRKPLGVHMSRDPAMLSWDTEPWETIDDYKEYRRCFREWGQPLATLEDWEDWQQFLAARSPHPLSQPSP